MSLPHFSGWEKYTQTQNRGPEAIPCKSAGKVCVHGCPTQDLTILSWPTVCDTNNCSLFPFISYCSFADCLVYQSCLWNLYVKANTGPKQAGDLQALSLWAGESWDGSAWRTKGQDLHLTMTSHSGALHVPDSMPGKPVVSMALLFHPISGCEAIKSSRCLCSLFLALLPTFHPSSKKALTWTREMVQQIKVSVPKPDSLS